MQVEVRLFATLRKNRFKKAIHDYPVGTTVGDITRALEIADEDIAIILINGRDGQLDTQLQEEDVLSIFPPVGGG